LHALFVSLKSSIFDNAMIVVQVGATFIASLVGLAFCLVTIILPAAEWVLVDDVNNYCKNCSAGQVTQQ